MSRPDVAVAGVSSLVAFLTWGRQPLIRFCLALLLSIVLAADLPAQGFTPEQAAKRMKLPEGFQAVLVAAEPVVRQPVAIEFDDRGRLWVIQYLQYPNPAGLKRVQVDRYSRTLYDRVPEPPPRGPKGADRITILEDLDQNGRAQRAKDFVTGLNLATGIAFGHGGVFVLQAPYLLFYPDRNGADVPDGDPQVLLAGFGMEDAHSVANSLTWGPDGWLYGCQGSTVTARIRGIEFQQGVWRYHPITHLFELFCEGGGNSWGLDFDQYGNLFYSTNVGGFCMLHGVQGGYYWKQFGKHGALHNPYAYGFFDHVQHRDFRGGHVTVGGILYQGQTFPAQFRGKYIAGDLLGHAVYWHDMEPSGSTFKSAHGGDLLDAKDTWFAPCDLTLGPDGSVYVADWYDKRTAHPDPDADWDRSNGRIYKIAAKGTNPVPAFDLTKLPSQHLVALLSHPNDWYVRKARRILADRRDPEVILPLRTLVLDAKTEQLALQALWALYVSGGFDEATAARFLEHSSPHVRSWTIRFLGDDGRISESLAKRLLGLAATDLDVRVRSQLASTARRLPARDGLPILEQILLRDEDEKDPHVPLLLWWGIEQHVSTSRDRILAFVTSSESWNSTLVRNTIVERLIRRFAAEGTTAGYDACARLLTSAPTLKERQRLLEALGQGLGEQRAVDRAKSLGTLFTDLAVVERKSDSTIPRPGKITPLLERTLSAFWSRNCTDPTLIALMLRIGKPDARGRAMALASDPRTLLASRIAMVQLLGESPDRTQIDFLLHIVGGNEPDSLQLAALASLGKHDPASIGPALLHLYPRTRNGLRSRAVDVLLSRRESALACLQAVDQGRLPAKDFAVDQLRVVSLYQDRRLDELVHRHWGSIQRGTPEEKLAEMRRLSNDLRAGAGNALRGKELFGKHCATCHRLFDEGNQVGPDLTYANRKDRDFLLVSTVDPSAVIRKEFLSYVVQTIDGRYLTGILADQNPGSITLLGAKNERTIVPRAQIETCKESAVSLMPENLLKDLKPDELRNLFAYLQSDKPLPSRK